LKNLFLSDELKSAVRKLLDINDFENLVDDDAWDVASLDESIKSFLDERNNSTEFIGKTEFTRVKVYSYSRAE
jgi:hypothetical protein